jgi:hypothetical protein
MKHAHQQGFTLIELAVAVTHIIGTHIAKAIGGETRIDAIHQHRFIITACGRSLAAKQ